jgi:hypothetical protein
MSCFDGTDPESTLDVTLPMSTSFFLSEKWWLNFLYHSLLVETLLAFVHPSLESCARSCFAVHEVFFECLSLKYAYLKYLNSLKNNVRYLYFHPFFSLCTFTIASLRVGSPYRSGHFRFMISFHLLFWKYIFRPVHLLKFLQSSNIIISVTSNTRSAYSFFCRASIHFRFS